MTVLGMHFASNVAMAFLFGVIGGMILRGKLK